LKHCRGVASIESVAPDFNPAFGEIVAPDFNRTFGDIIAPISIRRSEKSLRHNFNPASGENVADLLISIRHSGTIFIQMHDQSHPATLPLSSPNLCRINVLQDKSGNKVHL
jgi:hypothetical protein